MDINSVTNSRLYTSNDYFSYQESSTKQNNLSGSGYLEHEQAKRQKISKMKQMISGAIKEKQGPTSIIDSTLSYGDSIRAARDAAKNTATQVNKLKYNFKDISSQIRRSKTSLNAKQVASKARREVVLLKQKLQSGKYDEEEMEAAITHAKAMERAAIKKARHLEEEERIKIKDDESYDTSASQTEYELEDKAEETINEFEENMDEAKEALKEQMQESIEESVEEISEEMLELFEDTVEETIEETLGNLIEGLMSTTDYEMNEDEYKEFKMKHRLSEDKSMLEADAKYLKAIFDMYEKRMSSGATDITATQVNLVPEISASIPVDIPNIVDISV